MRKAAYRSSEQRKAKQERSNRSPEKQRVDARLLKAAIPAADEVKETLAGLAALRSNRAEAGAFEVPPAVECELDFGPHTKDWTSLLENFRRNHAWQFHQELGHDVVLCPIYPEEKVQKRFFDACRDLSHSISIGYHGTKKGNLSAIARNGLMVPGKASGIGIANGSAHGIGVYTARLGQAALSKRFSDTGAVFVCAICDTSSRTDDFVPSAVRVMRNDDFPKRRYIGNHNVKQESDEVLHVGHAMVVFEDRCIVPLFLASPSRPCVPKTSSGYEPAQQVGRRRLAVPDAGMPGIVRAGRDLRQLGRTVWMAPLPLADATPTMKRMKRLIVRKTHDKVVRSLRSDKYWQMVVDLE